MEGTPEKIRDVYVKFLLLLILINYSNIITPKIIFSTIFRPISAIYLQNFSSAFSQSLLAWLCNFSSSKISTSLPFSDIQAVKKRKKERKEMKFPTSFCIPWISHSSYLTLYTIMKLWFLMHNHTPPSLEEWKRISERWNVETRDGRVCVFFKFSFGILVAKIVALYNMEKNREGGKNV